MQMLLAAGGTATLLVLEVKELLCQVEGQPVLNNTSIISTSVLLTDVFLKVHRIMLFLIMLLFIKIFKVMYVFRTYDSDFNELSTAPPHSLYTSVYFTIHFSNK